MVVRRWGKNTKSSFFLATSLLVGVGRHLVVLSHALADDPQPPLVVLDVTAHLHLEHGETVLQIFGAQTSNLLVGITQPTHLCIQK